MAEQNEPCNCGAAVTVKYGPDIRFDPPCTKPMMWRAECSGDCLNPSFTAFTRERALELWNERMRKNREDDRAIVCISPWGRLKVGTRYVWVDFHEYCGPTFFTDSAMTKVYDPKDENDPVWPQFDRWLKKYRADKEKRSLAAARTAGAQDGRTG